jgi:glycosyltransferase involved in cell wall biosynthesis
MFSVVIPLFNKEKAISNTIQSILDQTYTEFEIVIVDDGSTDDSVSRVLNFRDDRIKLFQKENGGASSARNFGIEKSQSEYIGFIDADDLWKPEYLQEMSLLIKDFPDAGMWGSSYEIIENNVKLGTVDRDLPFGFRGIVYDYFSRKRNATLFCSSALVVKKEVFATTGNFDPRIKIGEDLDMWYRIILQFPIAYNNVTLAYYNHDSENRLSNLSRPDLSVCMPYYMDKFDFAKGKQNDFLRYFHTYIAGFILPYYFGNKQERISAKTIVSKFAYDKIKKKYYWLYKTPYLIGFMVMLLFRIKNRFYKAS